MPGHHKCPPGAFCACRKENEVYLSAADREIVQKTARGTLSGDLSRVLSIVSTDDERRNIEAALKEMLDNKTFKLVTAVFKHVITKTRTE